MIKKFAPMLLLLGASAAPLAWGQDERANENDEIQTSDESAIGADDVLEQEAGLNESDDAADTSGELTDPEVEDQPGNEVAAAEGEEADMSELAIDSSDESQSADETKSEVAESVDPVPNPTGDVVAGDAAGKETGAGHDSSVPDASGSLSPAPTPPKSPLILGLERLQQDAEASRGTKESNAIRPHTPKD